MSCRIVPLVAGLLVGIGSLAAAGEVRTVLGTGQPGYGGQELPAAETQINNPYGLVIGPDGWLYVCEIGNHLVRAVNLETGAHKVVAGSGKPGYSGDGGPATEALCHEPYEVRFDSLGNLLFVEMKSAVVRKVDSQGRISTIAGSGQSGFSGDGGPATEARLNQPHSIALDADDNVYICDIRNHRIRKVDAKTGIISTFSGTGERGKTANGAPIFGTPLNGPRALDADAAGFVLALREGNALYRVNLKDNRLEHLAGTGKKGYSGNPVPGPAALLSGPKGVAVGPSGDIYFADTESHTIRVYRGATGIVETVIGDGTRGDGPDGDPLRCRLARPHGVFVDAAGRVYVGDSENHRVRVLTPDP